MPHPFARPLACFFLGIFSLESARSGKHRNSQEVTIMSEIKVLDNGPLLVTGETTLLDGEGNKLEGKAQMYLCRCGLSTNKPFCNGAHKGKFESVVRA